MNAPALSARNIVKRYGAVTANDDVSLDLMAGEIHAVLGENGAGKSTLMRILYGMETPDGGEVLLDGKTLALASPRDAIRAGIGMVHQHFMLIPALTVLENLIIGTALGGRFGLHRGTARTHLRQLAARYRIDVDLDSIVEHLSVGAQQRVELLKLLVRNARILILDEPTAVLTPQEIADLGSTLAELKAQGHGIFIVTHKLSEVMAFSDRVSVMRQGRLLGSWQTARTNANELIARMIGRDMQPVLQQRRETAAAPMLEIQNLRTEGDHGRGRLQGLDLTVQAGEIVCVAGVEGNGQRDLVDAILGLCAVQDGHVLLDGEAITRRGTAEILGRGVAVVPEDRHRNAVILDFSLAENAILINHGKPPQRRGLRLDRGVINRFTDRLIRDFNVACGGPAVPMRSLSGGNQQKLVLARELDRKPRLLIAMQPTRGMDVGAIADVHRRLLAQRAAGMAILLISTELDEILALNDRVAVLREGRITGLLHRQEASVGSIGQLMLGAAV